ncbi:unnamed protein product, partial [Heterosigma akashiwo]
ASTRGWPGWTTSTAWTWARASGPKSVTAPGPGATPGRRAFHASFLHGAKFWIFGGADGTTRFGDLWSY